MTLKQPHPEGLLETTQILTEKEANDLLMVDRSWKVLLKHKSNH